MGSPMSIHDDMRSRAPLDPAAERLRRKLVRLLFVSGGIMMLGLIAVFAAIVYKVGQDGAGTAGRLGALSPVESAIACARRLSARRARSSTASAPC